MNISLHEITVRELTEGCTDSEEDGVLGYGGRLNIRPAFQREMIYNDDKRREVIRSIIRGFPLNVMYWVRTGGDSYEMLDGQQRTLSICKFVHGQDFLDDLSFTSHPEDIQRRVLDYRLMIYICEGEASEIMDWFRVINISGEKLTAQETRNASLTGAWLTDAKRLFSRKDCEAKRVGGDYMRGNPIRQEYLETVIRWTADRDGLESEDDVVLAYMSRHQHDENCNDMWLYFLSVMNWARLLFPKKDIALKSVEWGLFYNKYHTRRYDTKKLAARLRELQEDDEVTSAKGIYEYLIDGDEKHLNLRKFSTKIKRAVYERQGHKCAKCGREYELEQMEADHIEAWSRGGRTIESNCQVLCRRCNREKSNS